MSDTTMPSDEELIEKLAAIEHQRWADWQEWCHKILRENNPSPEIGDVLERWDRQIETPYAKLSESEKQSDRDQVKRYWPLLQKALHEAEVRARIEKYASNPCGYCGIPVPPVVMVTKKSYCNHSHRTLAYNQRIATLTAEKEEKV